jgi:hypothetical protein
VPRSVLQSCFRLGERGLTRLHVNLERPRVHTIERIAGPHLAAPAGTIARPQFRRCAVARRQHASVRFAQGIR